MPTRKKSPAVPEQGGSVTQAARGGAPAGCIPIAGMRLGWFYRLADRMILHQAKPTSPLLHVGEVPKVTALIEHLTDDGEPIRTEYQVLGRRQRIKRIITEDEIDRGTWAAKAGLPRPTGADERHAFAKLIREEGKHAPAVPARTYYTPEGDLVFPDADAQTLGYRTLGGTEENARQAWEEIGAYAVMDPKSALMMGAMFSGPLLDSLSVLAHVLNLYGTGQQGKSTALTVCCALYGNVKPRRQQLLMTWNSSKQGITQSLRLRGYLPMGLDERSTSGRNQLEASRELSQIVGGAIRMMGSADGSPRESDGFWLSILLSTSNLPLKFEGQSEDLASRLLEVSAPFFPNVWVDADGAPADASHEAAEHVSKRLKRLAREHGGWPIEWAVEAGAFQAGKLAELKKAHLKLCAKHSPRRGGIPDTIAEIHMAWVLGAHLLGQAIGVPELGPAAEQAAAERLADAIGEAGETNVPEGVRLWEAIDAMRLEASAFPEMEALPQIAHDGLRKLKGFTRSDRGQWWLTAPVVADAASTAGIENLTSALRQLDELGVHVREGRSGKSTRQTPKEIRGKGLPLRMHCFDMDRAEELFGEQAGGEDTPPAPDDTPPVEPGPAFEALELPVLLAPGDVVASRRHDATLPAPRQALEGRYVYPAAVPEVTDAEWADLVAKGGWRTLRHTQVGVLGVDGLHMPNHRLVELTALPATVDDVPALMEAYGLKSLWLHKDVLPKLGLPAYDQAKPGGPQGAQLCEWGTPGPVLAKMVPESGVSCWMTLTTQAGERLTVAIPAYEDRFDKVGLVGRGGFGGAEDAATLLDALMVYLLSTRHGRDKRDVIPYYLNPNKTAEDYAGGVERDDVVCEAIRAGQVPPVKHHVMVRPQWSRPITEEEQQAGYLHKFDRVAAYLAAYSSVVLGVGEPVHAETPIAYDKACAGMWRVASIPGTGDERLPELRFTEEPEGGFWLFGPDVDLLIELYPAWVPDVVEAYYWPNSKRALEGMYRRMHRSRAYIVEAHAAGRPGARWAKGVNGKLYQSFRGFLGRNRNNVKTDRETGELYEKDVFYRPDWAQLILSLAMANTYRALVKYAKAGRYPLSLYVDAATYTSDSPDPAIAKPEPMVLGTSGGTWTSEAVAAMADLRERFEAGENAHNAMREHFKSLEG